MKKNIVLSLLSLPLFCLAFWLWICNVAPARVMAYTDSSMEPKALIDKLDFIGIRDAPGYLGVMGRSDAKDLAEKALDEERMAWDQLNFFGRGLVSNSVLLQCPRQLHFQRLEFFQRVVNIPGNGLIELSDARLMVKEGEELALLNLRCSSLAVEAKDWRSRMVSRFHDRKA